MDMHMDFESKGHRAQGMPLALNPSEDRAIEALAFYRGRRVDAADRTPGQGADSSSPGN